MTMMQPPEAPPLGQGLDRLFAPRSIAIVGASDRPGSFGRRTQVNLSAFEGELFLINPKRAAEGGEIDGRRAWASLDALPTAPDMVMIATPKDTVQGVVEAAAAKGAGGAVVFASGFQELGTEEGVAAQRALAAAARRGGMRLTGPNTIGFVNFRAGVGATFLSDLHLDKGFGAPAESRRIGLVSQSGALGLALTQGMMPGRFFSHCLTMGNSADVDVADCIAFLAQDPDCKAIACNFEGHADPRRVAAAAKLASDAGKALVVYKMATGEAGATAAASHTGNLAGSHEAYRTMFEHSGAVMVDHYEALLETADFFARATPNKGEGMAVVATSGGAAIMAADAAEKHKVPLPLPDAALTERLEARIPDFGAATNPCDVTAQVINDMESLIDCAEGFLERDDYGALMMPHLFAYESSFARIPVMDELGGRHRKLIMTVWMSSWLEGPGLSELLEKPNTAVFHSLDRCFETYAAWRRWLKRGALTAEAGPVAPAGAMAAAEAALSAAPGPVLAERDAKPVFAAYGVDAIGEASVDSASAARAAAEAAGFPVVLKLDAPDLAHKTEVGGVELGLAVGEAVAAAFETMMAKAAAAGVTPRGALV
ncbi:MAG: CoA-binding protein, partial [Pseudomonadota bacterium]